MKFKKISAVLGTILMTGLTLGTAAAASYPAPFVESGVANVAIVYGTGAGVSSLDMVQAGNIQTSLGSSVKGGVSTATGDSYKIERSSNFLYFDVGFTDIVNSGVLRDSELEDFLADGTYINADNDEVDFTQEITLEDNALTYFSDRNYESKEPTLGFVYDKNDGVLTYTLTFDDTFTDDLIEETDITILGKEYYVLSSDLASDTITLLDTSMTEIIEEGSSVTMDGKSIVVDFIDANNNVKLKVDGVLLKALAAGDTFKLKDGSVIAVKEVLSSSRDSQIPKAEITVGSGKLVLTDGDLVDLNGEDVDGLTVGLSNSTGLEIELIWTADTALFLTPENELVMPGFGSVKLSMADIDFPTPSMVTLEGGEDQLNLLAEIEKGDLDLPLFYRNSTDGFDLGKASDEILVTSWYTESGDDYVANITSADRTLFLNISEEPMFVVTYISTNGNSAYTYAYQFDSINARDGKTSVKLTGLTGESAIEFSDIGRSSYLKDLTFELLASAGNESTTALIETDADAGTAVLKVTAIGGTVYVDRVATTEGLVMMLPTSAIDPSGTWDMNFYEEDKDGYVENTFSSESFYATVSAGEEIEVSAVSTDFETQNDLSNSKISYGYIMSPLATKMTLDKTASVNEFEIEYHNEAFALDVFVSEAGATLSRDALGDVLVKDTEVETVKAKNLVIVGGSCINSAAATVLGLPQGTCGAAFTEATGVSAGQFLIKGVQDAYTTGKLALVVAGYEAADTVNAATYLTMKKPDTSGEWKGTSATNAELVLA